MSGGDIRTARQARQALNLADHATAEELRRAFRAAVRKAHPDHGGDAEHLRRVVDAHRLLSDMQVAGLRLTPAPIMPGPPMGRPAAKPHPPASPLEIDALSALNGGGRDVGLPGGRTGRVRLPPGLRNGDKIRLKTPAGPVLFKITIAAGDISVRGDDLWMTAAVPDAVLEQGGRVDIDTPAGRRPVSLSAAAAQRGLVRLPGLGLPERGKHPQGHLFVRLEADGMPSAGKAREMLRRFAAAWAA